MYRVKIISFIAFENEEDYIYDIRKQIELLKLYIADTPHRKERIVAETENEKIAEEIFENEKKKIKKTEYNVKDKCYTGEELILTEVEVDGIFKGLDYPENIKTYIKFD